MQEKKLISRILTTLFVIGLIYSSQAQTNKKAQEFGKLFQYCFKQGMFNGNVLIVENGKTIYKKSFGHDGSTQKMALTSQSQFLLASVSKQFTAMGVVILKEQNKLNYDALVSQYLGDFPYKDVTVRHLLNHTSGIVEYMRIINSHSKALTKRFKNKGKRFTNKDVVAMFKKRKPALRFTPGSKFGYSNTGYVYLVEIIEKISKMPFDKFMAKHIFEPLKMTQTLVYNAQQKQNLKHKTQGYRLGLDGKKIIPNDSPAFFNVVGGGGIYSSTPDLQKWSNALQTGTLISKEALAEAWNPPSLKNKEQTLYGFGWFVRTLPFNGHKILTHSGEFVGFSNSFLSDVTQNHALILLANNSNKYRKKMNTAMMRILYNKPYSLPKLHINEKLGKIIATKGIKEAVATYTQLKESKSKQYNFSENRLNRLGYDLMKASRTNEAIEIFKLNVQSFPASANTHDSLAEAYLANQQKALALKHYKKALAIRPRSKRVAKIVKKLERKQK